MAYTVWPGSPWIEFETRDERRVAEIRNGRPGFVRTVPLESLERRMYALPEQVTDAERQTIVAFLRARGWTEQPFLFEDPKDATRTGIALVGAVNGSNKVFSLPTSTTDHDYRHFPKQGSVVAKVDGSPVSVDVVDTDARTVTLVAAPAAGVVTADFTGLRLVRVKAPPEMKGVTAGVFGYVVELEEILRETA